MRRYARWYGAALLALGLLLLACTLPSQTQGQQGPRCFDETGFCIEGRIRQFWEQNGGLPVFGLPITEQRLEEIEGRSLQVQWFERNRLELHPENEPPFDVQLGLLGIDALEQQDRSWFDFPQASTPQLGCRYFAETSQNVCGEILDTWSSSGLTLDDDPAISAAESTALFGLPISPLQEEIIEGQRLQVQWFQRARFELHPENEPPFNVQLGLLGREVLRGADTPPVAVRPTEPPPPAEPAGPLSWPSISFSSQVTGLLRPTHLTHAGDSSGRIFVTEQEGTIRVIQDGALLPTPLLDISDRVRAGGERGLLSVAFPPDFASKRYFYVDYTNINGDTLISRYRLTADDNVADPNSEEVLLLIEQPYPNHNGGQLAFGPDGYLYIGMGDGGSGGDPDNNGQNPGSLLGTILRIDTESGSAPYAIPPDNPFVGDDTARDEVWAYGLRNPWRFAFDRQTGELYIADVGQSGREEINVQLASSGGGENYGWNIMEGSACFGSDTCDTAGLTLPVAEYGHGSGHCSVTGGMVYRGSQFPALQGIYLYADYCSGQIWGLQRQGNEWVSQTLTEVDYTITSFGEDEAGNLYLLDYGGGTVYLITN
jgi:glucose/arabinose dehydrogenase